MLYSDIRNSQEGDKMGKGETGLKPWSLGYQTMGPAYKELNSQYNTNALQYIYITYQLASETENSLSTAKKVECVMCFFLTVNILTQQYTPK